MVKGQRVILRVIEDNDLELCQKLFNDPNVRRMVVGWDFPVSMEAQRQWLSSLTGKKNDVRFVIETEEGKSIGVTGLWDIDWHNRHALTATKLLPSDGAIGKGYGRDAIMTVSAYAFYEVGLNRLWGSIIDYNKASFKAYVERSGWRVEGRLRKHIFRSGTFHDLYYVACLKSDFEIVPDAKAYRAPYLPPEIDDTIEWARFVAEGNPLQDLE